MIQDYLNKNFFPVYKKYLIFLEKPFFKKLKSTNDILENYFRNTLDKHKKEFIEFLKEYLTTYGEKKWMGRKSKKSPNN